jgi:hypothetical protein
MNEERERKMWALINWREKVLARSVAGKWYIALKYNNFNSSCSYCEWADRESKKCSECPVSIDGETCGDDQHLWRKWEQGQTKEMRRHYAKKLLNHIKSIPVPPRGSE